MTSYVSAPIPSFSGGLNLRDKADALGPEQAIDLMNVVFTERGAVKQRDGYDNLNGTPLTNPVKALSPYYTTSGTKQLLADGGTRLEALNTSGAVVASQTALNTGTWSFVRFGAPGAERAYAGNGKNLLQKWDGSAWSSVSNSPKARYLAVMAADQGNRLVATGFDDGTNGPSAAQVYTSHVHFSDPGDPETWTANNYLQFTPGDGELIQGVIAWREFVFVFKETKFFVIYGTDTDPNGVPIFRYRTVDAGAGLASPRALTAHRSGVYFMGRRGVYRTTGGEPELLSDIINPIWQGSSPSYFTGGVMNLGQITNAAAGFWNERLYLAYTSANVSINDKVLVYDPRFDWWSLYDFPAYSFCTFRAGNSEDLFFGFTVTGNYIGQHSSAYTNDNGLAISSRWRSGWFDYGDPDTKTIRETKMWGSGQCNMGISDDFEIGTGTSDFIDMTAGSGSAADTWSGTTWGGGTWAATSSQISEIGVLNNRSTTGTVFSTYFSNSTLDQAWTVNRLTHHLREIRVPSIVSAHA